jgi:hypothetical protein
VRRSAIALAIVVHAAVAAADGVRIGLVASEDAIQGPLLLALRLEFPEAEVLVVPSGAPTEGFAATIAVARAGASLRVRVDERGAPIGVDREIPVESGDEAAAQAVALLARSLLGVALLYEPERAAAEPALAEIARAPARRATKALVPEARATASAAPAPEAPLLLSAGAAIVGSFPPAPTVRPGARFALSWRWPIAEASVEAAWLASAEVESAGAYRVRYSGVPVGAWARLRVATGVVEAVPGVGVTVERSAVTASLVGRDDREFRDWNLAAGIDARLRWAATPGLSLDWGVRLDLRNGRQEYEWADEIVLAAPGLGWAADLGIGFSGP